MLEKGHALDPGKDRLMKNHGGIPGSLASATHVSISHNRKFFKDDAQPLFQLRLHLLATQDASERKSRS